MSSSKSHIEYLATVILVSVCLFEQASSMRCYSCDSDNSPNCIYNPTLFGVTCAPYARNMNSSVFNTADALPYDCATAVGIGTKDGHFRLIRGCSIKPVTCDTYKTIYAVNYNFQVDECIRCGYDFCNSATF